MASHDASTSAISPSVVARPARRAVAARAPSLCADALVLSSTRPATRERRGGGRRFRRGLVVVVVGGGVSRASSHCRAASSATIPPYEWPTSTTGSPRRRVHGRRRVAHRRVVAVAAAWSAHGAARASRGERRELRGAAVETGRYERRSRVVLGCGRSSGATPSLNSMMNWQCDSAWWFSRPWKWVERAPPSRVSSQKSFIGSASLGGQRGVRPPGGGLAARPLSWRAGKQVEEKVGEDVLVGVARRSSAELKAPDAHRALSGGPPARCPS